MPFGECNEVAGWIPRSLHSFRSRSSKRGFSAASHLRLLDLSDLAGGERRPARLLRARFPLLSVIGNSCRCNTPLHATARTGDLSSRGVPPPPPWKNPCSLIFAQQVLLLLFTRRSQGVPRCVQ